MKKSTNILVSDPDSPFCNVLCKVLTKEGYTVTCVPNAHQALQHLQAAEYTFVIVNIADRKPENLALLQSFFEHAKKARVIVTTNFQDEAFSQKNISMGAIGCFMKPFKREQILTAIEQSLK
ncbi:response regulator [Candidatus Saccharibacteria bacterium]|nr:response regulator [Candidatus Saccharibacteria bacterium]NIV03789.1 response regulator [Calditrichia bacterium]NIV71813.1 response regulator [Calditrichia bacterium]NIV98961.1 response regulator [Candidatus Saccharibacteria bacterium]NIW78653.1 response regulator [Calditrichia bacterium]